MSLQEHLSARTALAALAGGALIALTWEWLSRGTGVGAGWTVFVLLASGVLVVFLLWSRTFVNWWTLWLLLPTTLLAIDAMVYENPVVNFFAPVATVILLSAFATLAVSPVTRFAAVGELVSLDTGLDWLRAIPGIAWIGRAIRDSSDRSPLRDGVLGILLAIPFLLIFLALFAHADVLVLRALRQVIQPETVGIVIRRVLFGIVVAGYLATLARSVRAAAAPRATIPSTATNGTALGFFVALDVLFVAFLLIQAVELFGGEAFRAAHDITYAEYARSGFFELLVAAGLAAAIVLAWYTKLSDSSIGRPARNAVMAFLIGTSLVAASSVWRIVLYTQTYGLTLARTYASIAVLTIVIGLVFLGLALQERRARTWLHRNLSLLAIVVFTITMTLPIERGVAEWNVQRYIRGEHRAEFDQRYVRYLSADAWPALARLARVDPSTRSLITNATCAMDIGRQDYDAHESGKQDDVWYRDPHWQSTNILEALWCTRLPEIQAELRTQR